MDYSKWGLWCIGNTFVPGLYRLGCLCVRKQTEIEIE